ncbi:MAG TPA: hypothetical protein VNG33_14440 [Polyangiaceae bacterium]|nr:hypothetical protein [Polyangiaceae bacterium]
MLPRHRFSVASRRVTILACFVALSALALGCHQPETILTRLDDARSLTADLRVEFNKAADASNRAVMADTDEASIAYAKESETATRLVQSDMAALAPLLGILGFSTEIHAFEAFKTRFSEYHKLDGTILALAVENTNLKAQGLSFGPARQAADAFRDALAPLAASLPPKDRCQATELVAQAVTAVREIQVLHAPHIAERDDAPMTKMEKEMADRDSSARAALKTLDELAPPSAQPALATAHAELDKFKALTAQIVQLSRRNTNVVSLDLSLRQKPPLAASCDERLSALQQVLAHEGSKATR